MLPGRLRPPPWGGSCSCWCGGKPGCCAGGGCAADRSRLLNSSAAWAATSRASPGVTADMPSRSSPSGRSGVPDRPAAAAACCEGGRLPPRPGRGGEAGGGRPPPPACCRAGCGGAPPTLLPVPGTKGLAPTLGPFPPPAPPAPLPAPPAAGWPAASVDACVFDAALRQPGRHAGSSVLLTPQQHADKGSLPTSIQHQSPQCCHAAHLARRWVRARRPTRGSTSSRSSPATRCCCCCQARRAWHSRLLRRRARGRAAAHCRRLRRRVATPSAAAAWLLAGVGWRPASTWASPGRALANGETAQGAPGRQQLESGNLAAAKARRSIPSTMRSQAQCTCTTDRTLGEPLQVGIKRRVSLGPMACHRALQTSTIVVC